MDTQQKEVWLRKVAIVSVLPFAALGLAGCDTSGSEEGADVEDVVEEQPAAETPTEEEPVAEEPVDGLAYDGVYDATFYEDYNSYVGEQVTVSAEVNEIINNMAFTIAGTDDTTVDPLLIVHEGEIADLNEGLTVAVVGTVKEGFDLPAVEEEMGIDLDDAGLEEWDGQNYIEASGVDTSVNADPEDDE